MQNHNTTIIIMPMVPFVPSENQPMHQLKLANPTIGDIVFFLRKKKFSRYLCTAHYITHTPTHMPISLRLCDYCAAWFTADSSLRIPIVVGWSGSQITQRGRCCHPGNSPQTVVLGGSIRRHFALSAPERRPDQLQITPSPVQTPRPAPIAPTGRVSGPPVCPLPLRPAPASRSPVNPLRLGPARAARQDYSLMHAKALL